MEIFNKHGHITEQGFHILLNESPSDLERLEIAEHLSFCSECLNTYSNMAENTLLPEKIPFDEDTLYKKIIKKQKFSKFRIYFSTGAAAAAVIVFMNASIVFHSFSDSEKTLNFVPFMTKIFSTMENYQEKLNDSIKNISDKLMFINFEEDFSNGE